MTDDPKYKIVSVDLDERTVVRRNAEIEHERAVAIFDLLENNYFKPVSLPEGPYAIDLSVEENRLNLVVRNQDKSAELGKLVIQLRAFRRIIRDYFLICESYYTAIKDSSLSQIEAIDMGRRGLHNEGADLLKETLAAEVAVDGQTARRLFTLLCVLHIRG
ncbi:MAG TPA: hypothetical protein DFI00_05505 [Rhodospirillaceae bacterium]|mgnify:CR=1 FL=1|nr:hypothetical protein [Alphaproteobacteria bacterium]OUT42078.1 MAG: hypothetical protein CBB62_07195 [Micavibrio sp. TMED2]HCI46730.1 hypothetical protein [Rhodospirillaceae bacterium]MAS46312.1 hypothetical protein [Alphaproteobacteria bacterium]MAX95502.1 hypothetical protein [Alphaproteobacteria bacterium]|tara:strand:+ start:169 stop:651 length:483 start_codon:yes stop_codon:yes gene_type:complete